MDILPICPQVVPTGPGIGHYHTMQIITRWYRKLGSKRERLKIIIRNRAAIEAQVVIVCEKGSIYWTE
jgi:hypothetical protein